MIPVNENVMLLQGTKLSISTAQFTNSPLGYWKIAFLPTFSGTVVCWTVQKTDLVVPTGPFQTGSHLDWRDLPGNEY